MPPPSIVRIVTSLMVTPSPLWPAQPSALAPIAPAPLPPMMPARPVSALAGAPVVMAVVSGHLAPLLPQPAPASGPSFGGVST
jgi:hypothetical protein